MTPEILKEVMNIFDELMDDDYYQWVQTQGYSFLGEDQWETLKEMFQHKAEQHMARKGA